MTEVVAALIWQGERFMACQRPAHKARGLLWEFVGGKVLLNNYDDLKNDGTKVSLKPYQAVVMEVKI